jgi:predicted phosphodiesterase
MTNSSGVLLKIAVMSDIHNNTSGLKRMMRKAKDDGMNIVALAGDLTTDGSSSQLKAVKNVLDSSGMRYESTEGNHDMRKGLFDDIFGKSFQSIKFNGAKLILIDNSDYRGLDSGVLKGRGQKAWIESEVAECRRIICIGIMHMPLNHPTSGHVMGEEGKNAASEAIWLRKLLVSSGVKEIETGHIHHFATYTLDGLKTNQVGPGTSSDFSEFTIYGSGEVVRDKITL